MTFIQQPNADNLVPEFAQKQNGFKAVVHIGSSNANVVVVLSESYPNKAERYNTK